MMSRTFIVNYGVGNVGSLQNMYRKATGQIPELIETLNPIKPEDRILLPGVGNFGFAMRQLENLQLVEPLKELAASNEVYLLGICLGAQLLLDRSEEADERGLGIISGSCVRFLKSELPAHLRIPHMGWSEIKASQHTLARGILPDSRFYFVHSYKMQPEDHNDVLFTAEHGSEFCAGIVRNRTVGVQFHPEKSHRYGMEFLRSFAAWNE
jgi:glutamine amidotransferase